MRKCYYCLQEFEKKSQKQRFCKDSHRVMFSKLAQEEKDKRIAESKLTKPIIKSISIEDVIEQFGGIENLIDAINKVTPIKISPIEPPKPTVVTLSLPKKETPVLSQYEAYEKEIREASTKWELGTLQSEINKEKTISSLQRVALHNLIQQVLKTLK